MNSDEGFTARKWAHERRVSYGALLGVHLRGIGDYMARLQSNWWFG